MSSAYMHHFVIKYRLLGTNMQKESTVIIGVIIIIFILKIISLSVRVKQLLDLQVYQAVVGF